VTTISRWVREFLHQAGVDTEKFKAHSVRGATTSKAKKEGLSVEMIVQKANWSNAKTFQKFYCRETVSNEQFAKTVLNLH
jgi:hypothetical protein